MEPKPSRLAKDHLFVDMFNQPKYCLELFRALHPEATDITEADIQRITISHVIVDKPYNDLGFIVRDRLLVLVEAQSTWSGNILLRTLLYLADTYLGIISEHEDWDIHSTGRLPMPSPEFYVIYTGNRRNVPKQISMRKDFFRDERVPLDLVARVISAESTEDIIGQYIIFSHVYDRQVKLYGRVEQAARETIRICKDMDVLKAYLTDCEKEVITHMIMLFEQEEAMRRHDNRLAAEARAEGMAKGMAKGIAKGIAKGRAEGMAEGRAEGKAEGMAEGRAEGMAKGRAEGMAKGRLSTLSELVNDGIFTLEEAARKMGMTAQAFQDAVRAL